MNLLDIHPEVADAIAGGQPVVALESTIVTHGLPRPDNLVTARQVEEAVRAEGAVPATVAIVDGRARVGLDAATLERIAASDTVAKAGLRDLAPVAAVGGSASTTVGATAHLARQAGIRFFATGGLGGVHREARETWDESADLDALSRCGIAVVCSGVKSILDVAATLERLESLNVAVVGYATNRFPGFYLTDSGHRLEWRVDSPSEAAALVGARDALGLSDRAVVFANPLPPADQLDPALHDRVLAAGLAACAVGGVHGKDVTPFLLDYFHRETAGASLTANIALITRNAALAARIAVAAAAR
ncbi:pseudouridine-5'-phosphate glycosidase [Yinghuangia sp. YIM S10712]|uniref:pseudouridine-5'-phosphate glycosidase n=1 Tax=Yinghuangia sp. YIM S10712 TaxID=3436930 RepID=UPI003F535160